MNCSADEDLQGGGSLGAAATGGGVGLRWRAGARRLGTVCRLVSVELTADSTPAAVQQAAARAVAEAAREAGTIRLEPMVQVEVTTTEEHLGTVLSDLNANRRGEIGELATLPDGRRVAHATVALATMVGYASALRSSTKGASSFHMAFSHFAPE